MPIKALGGSKMDKKGRFATLLFVLVILLPLLGVLIMDYQLTRANDITGASALTASIPFDSARMISAIVSVVVVVAALSVFLISKVIKSGKKSDPVVSAGSDISPDSAVSAAAPSEKTTSVELKKKEDTKEIKEQKETNSASLLDDAEDINAEIERLNQELKSF